MRPINMLDTSRATSLPIDLLRTFVAAVDCGSFTRAAHTVHRTQAAVSMQMARLEDEVGTLLFRRAGRGVTLTLEGETLVEYARRLLSLHDEALSAVTAPEMEGRVRLGAPEDYASWFLPQMLAAFHETHPLVRVEVFCGTSQSLNLRFQRGELDLTILSHAADPLDDQTAEVIHREPIVWVTGLSGNAHEREPLPLAVFHDGCTYRRWAVEGCERMGRDYRIAFVSPSLTGVLSAVKAGLGVAPVGRSTVDGELRLLGESEGFPALPSSTVCLHRHPGAHGEIVEGLARFIRRKLV
ncbi:LysR substrate-binding domain-containing protein [Desulfovibrio oxyclinae]|uniref:LysR substrate-binding domain-containing protein n=1 Tax=Desulfovibrio oxyclinae TaxID=63560 RepID=UPI000381E41C|nr:LysR substrate-binding domain-containing protein [Desulfovibrio oxyclinae]